jgi:hypothetical protein
MKKVVKVILVGIVIILSLYFYSQKPNFDMNGTIEDITIPCSPNTTCNPQFWLDAEDNNTYRLLISSSRLPDGSQQICEGSLAVQEPCLTRVPKFGQHIEVIGYVTYNTYSCGADCQPIGTVNVLNWRQR